MKELFITDEKELATFWDMAPSLRRFTLSERQLLDLELILNGAFYPLTGFLNEDDYQSVVNTMHLSSGALWPMPITLDTSDESYKVGEEIILVDQYGNPIALMRIESVYTPDRLHEANMVFGTTDEAHPGVQYVTRETNPIYLGGTVKGIGRTPRFDFTELRKTPSELRAWIKEQGWNTVVAFQTRNPVHRAHYEIMQEARKSVGSDAKLLIHPVVGTTKEGDIDYITRVRSYKRLRDEHMSDHAALSLLPLAMRMGGPREAVWHALIRKNYGATHFIVGRDHAGPGNDSTGKPMYDAYAAQKLAVALESEIGITILPQQERHYIEELDAYVSQEEIQPHHTVRTISGTKFREMLRGGEDIPPWFSFPAVIEVLRAGAKKQKKEGLVLFFTGLSGAGKSTIANLVATKLLEIQDKPITYLDGDIVRQKLSKGLGFSREDRMMNIERIGFVANEIARHGGIAICAAIAPYEEARAKNRRLIEKHGTYVEVYVATTLEECQKRDTKGLYKGAAQGVTKNVTGVSDPYEAPRDPEITIDTANVSPEACATAVLEYLRQKNLITAVA
jgi:sulfate adenylyltransferase